MARQERLGPGIQEIQGRVKDGRGYYRLRYRDPRTGKIRFRGLGRGNNQELNEAADAFRATLSQGKPIPKRAARTVGQAWEAYRLDRLPELRTSTRQSYESIWRCHLEPEISGLKVQEVQRKRLREVLDQAEARTSATTRNRVLEVVKAFFGYCVREQWAYDNPATLIAKATAEGADVRDIATPAVLKLLAVLDGQDRMMIHTLAVSGLRFGEVLGLQWGDMKHGDWQNATVRIRRDFVRGVLGPPKTEASKRTVPLTGSLRDQFREAHKAHKARGEDDEAFIFPNRAGGPTCGDDWRKRTFDPARVRAKVRFTIKDLRAYAITRMIRDGMNLLEVQRIAGHTQASTTMRYYLAADREALDKARRAAVADGL